MADCGLRRLAPLMGIGRIADCTLGTLQRKDARCRVCWGRGVPGPDCVGPELELTRRFGER
eukprot:11647026-Alexandrium_andersonii.AAC.1